MAGATGGVCVSMEVVGAGGAGFTVVVVDEEVESLSNEMLFSFNNFCNLSVWTLYFFASFFN